MSADKQGHGTDGNREDMKKLEKTHKTVAGKKYMKS